MVRSLRKSLPRGDSDPLHGNYVLALALVRFQDVALNEEDIQVAIVVEIKERRACTHDLWQKKLTRHAVVVPEPESTSSAAAIIRRCHSDRLGASPEFSQSHRHQSTVLNEPVAR